VEDQWDDDDQIEESDYVEEYDDSGFEEGSCEDYSYQSDDYHSDGS